ncbi:MAG: hypothetical protein ABJO86_10370 [Lentilitoribacter sp.]
MKKTPHSHEHEKIVAQALAPVARELRLIDIADLIAMLKYERHASLSELVTSAAELYFLPETVKLGAGGDYVVDWDYNPKIVLDLEIHPNLVTVYVRVTLEKDYCGIEISHIEFRESFMDLEESASFLRQSLENAAFSMHKMPEIPEAYRAV